MIIAGKTIPDERIGLYHVAGRKSQAWLPNVAPVLMDTFSYFLPLFLRGRLL